jgi:Bacterial TSP3 repeat
VSALVHRLPLFGLLLAAPVFASAQYPGLIQTDLSLSALPPQSCSLCHVNGIGNIGTANTPFGKAMRMQGLVFENDASLKAALMALETAGTDSDGDGVSDIAELRAGTDPNVGAIPDGGAGGGGGSTAGTLRYGCGADQVPQLLAGLALVLLLTRRRG